MTVEVKIYNLLKGLVADRVFPDVAPVMTQRPYITYQKVGGQVVNYVEGTLPTSRNGRYQINVWADSRMSAEDISQQVETAMITATDFSVQPDSASRSDYDPDIPVYGAMQDFSIWSDR